MILLTKSIKINKHANTMCNTTSCKTDTMSILMDFYEDTGSNIHHQHGRNERTQKLKKKLIHETAQEHQRNITKCKK